MGNWQSLWGSPVQQSKHVPVLIFQTQPDVQQAAVPELSPATPWQLTPSLRTQVPTATVTGYPRAAPFAHRPGMNKQECSTDQTQQNATCTRHWPFNERLHGPHTETAAADNNLSYLLLQGAAFHSPPRFRHEPEKAGELYPRPGGSSDCQSSRGRPPCTELGSGRETAH